MKSKLVCQTDQQNWENVNEIKKKWLQLLTSDTKVGDITTDSTEMKRSIRDYMNNCTPADNLYKMETFPETLTLSRLNYK